MEVLPWAGTGSSAVSETGLSKKTQCRERGRAWRMWRPSRSRTAAWGQGLGDCFQLGGLGNE